MSANRIPLITANELKRRVKTGPAEWQSTNGSDGLILEDSFNGVRAAHATGAMMIMVPDVVPPTPEIAALCAGVAADLHQVREIIRRNAQPR